MGLVHVVKSQALNFDPERLLFRFLVGFVFQRLVLLSVHAAGTTAAIPRLSPHEREKARSNGRSSPVITLTRESNGVWQGTRDIKLT